MIPLPPELVRAVRATPVRDYTSRPIQLGLGRDPFRIVVASQMLYRTKSDSITDVLQEVLVRWPVPTLLASSDVELEQVLMPLRLWRNRTRSLQRMAHRWDTPYRDLRNLPGVGEYVADAVSLFCFGHTTVVADAALTAYAAAYDGPQLTYEDELWYVRWPSGGKQFARYFSPPAYAVQYFERLYRTWLDRSKLQEPV